MAEAARLKIKSKIRRELCFTLPGERAVLPRNPKYSFGGTTMSGKLHISRWMGIGLLLLAFGCVQAVAQDVSGQAGQAASQAGQSAKQAGQAASQAGQEAEGAASSMEVSPEVQQKLQKLSSALNLTDDQKTEIKPILQREVQKLKSIRNDSSMSDEQKRAQAQEVHAAAHSEIQSLLTPKQQQKLEQMKNDAML